MDSKQFTKRLIKSLSLLEDGHVTASDLKKLVERDARIELDASTGANVLPFPKDKSSQKVA